MKVLSLFDGISCGRVALERASIPVDSYYASEIDKYAIQATQKNYPDTIQLGDITKVNGCDLPEIDLLIGGSPCQGFSFAGKMLNFKDPRSALFFEFVRLLKECEPVYFLLENVKMKQEHQDIISGLIGLEPVEINSALVSGQNRVRLYWTNIPNVTQPVNKGILFTDISDDGGICASMRGRRINPITGKRNDYSDIPIAQYIEPRSNNKSNCLTTVDKDNVVVAEKASTRKVASDTKYRFLSLKEYEVLQTLPLNYTKGIGVYKAKALIGNGWTIDIIAHIFKGMDYDKHIN